MFCDQCGKPLKEDQTVCPECGAPVAAAKAASQPQGTQTNAELKAAGADAAASLKTLFKSLAAAVAASAPVQKLKALPTKQKQILGGAVGAVVLLLVCVALLGGRGYKKTVDVFVNKAVKAPSGKAVVSLVPNRVLNKLFEDVDYTKADMIEDINDAGKQQQKQLKKALGEGWKLSYTIVHDEQLDEDDLEDIQDDYEDYYDVKVKDARTVEVKLRFKGPEEDATATMKLPLIQVGNSWYLDYMEMGNLMGSIKLKF